MRKLTGRIAAVSLLALGACAQTPAVEERVVIIRSEPAPTPEDAPAAGAAPVAPAPPPVAEAPKPPAWIGRLEAAAKANTYRLNYDGTTFSGPGWDMLVAEGQAAQFFLLGEEHGIAENPKLAGQLFGELSKSGYSKFVIEVSPPMATALDAAALKGVAGLKAMYAQPGGEPAFFGMKEEAEMIARVRASVPGTAPVLWGVDYEVGGDRLLITELEAMKKPKAAEDALATLRAASTAAWAKYAAEKNPGFMFTFSGDPALVRAVEDAWPGRSAAASGILTALEETLEINKLWVEEKGYESNFRRSSFMRANFLSHWNAEKAAGRKPKVFVKMGASHLTRGANMTQTFDIGTLAPDLAFIEGGKALQVMILPGKGSATAVFDPVNWVYNPVLPEDGYMKGLDLVLNAADPRAFTVIDLRPLRAVLSYWRDGVDPELMQAVHGFDMLIVMSRSTASANLGR